MQPNAPFAPLDESPKKSATPRIIWAIMALIVVGGGYWFSQSSTTGEIMNTTIDSIQTKQVVPGYLDNSDPVLVSIKGRALADLVQSIKRADPESAENKSFATQAKGWSQERQNQLQALFEESINDYAAQTHLSDVDFGTFMLVFQDFKEMEQKRIAEEHDIRVQYLGGDKYVAEFWQDGLAVYSEKNVPDNERKAVAKERYAIVRKSIEDGQQERYTKMFALLYTRENDGSITFHDPFQPMIDFMASNTASGGEVNR